MDLDPLASEITSEVDQAVKDRRTDPVVAVGGHDVHRLDVAVIAIW
jgi:hypothetical protein